MSDLAVLDAAPPELPPVFLNYQQVLMSWVTKNSVVVWEKSRRTGFSWTAVLAPMGRPDVKVTIIVRAPEALPSECMISTNDDLSVVADAVAHWAARR
jgi:hypothetical protein